MKGEDEIGGFRDLGCRRDHRGADENRSRLIIRAGEDACVSNRTDGALVSRKFRAIRMHMAHLHKASERHGHHAKKT